jgi:hypothetical protein
MSSLDNINVQSENLSYAGSDKSDPYAHGHIIVVCIYLHTYIDICRHQYLYAPISAGA